MEGPSSSSMMILHNLGDDQEDVCNNNMDLPPGFRFHPTDEEIISHYLTPKVKNNGAFTAVAVGEVDLNKCEPWDLHKKAKMGEKEWYFFCQRDRKYPTGMRTNRATESGYWKATGKDKEIYKKGRGGSLIGMKKTLVFYKGRAPKGEKTNWVMHEYRLEGQFSYYNFPKPAKDEYVVCRIFHKSTGIKRSPIDLLTRMNSASFVDDLIMDYPNNSLPPLVEQQPAGNNSSFTDRTTEDDYATAKGKGPASSSSPRSSDGGYLTTRSSDGGYLPYFPNDPSFNDIKNHVMPYPNYMDSRDPMFQFYNQIPQHYSSNNTIFPFKQASTNPGYYYNSGLKNESNTMSVSQDTGVSTDATTAETSSVISKKDVDQDRSFGPVSDDLDCFFWNHD